MSLLESGAGIKAAFFFPFVCFVFFKHRIKHESWMRRFLTYFPPFYSEGALDISSILEWQASITSFRVLHRGSTCFSVPGSPGGRIGGRVVFPSSDSWAVVSILPAGTRLGGKTCILWVSLSFRLTLLLPLLSSVTVLWLAVAKH